MTQGYQDDSVITMASPEVTQSAPVEIVPTRDGYDRWAEVYDDEFNPLVLLEEPRVVELLGEVRGLTIADIGCGTGRHAVRLANAGALVTGVDFSDGMAERMRQKAGAEGVNFVRHDIEQPLPLPDASFDRVLCCLVLDHIASPLTLFGELHRLCRADGFVLVTVMHPAMELMGVQARFTDPASGRKVSPQSQSHQVSDYVMAALRAGLVIDHLSEHACDAAFAERVPRAARYVDWPMLLVMRMRPGALFTVAKNKQLIRRYYDELWNGWRMELIDGFIADDIAFRGSLGVEVRGRDGFRQYVETVRAAFPDFHNTIEELIAEDDRVVAQLTYRGTHRGELFGIAPTGKPITYSGLAIFKITAGKIVEGFVLGDTTSLRRQIGDR